MLNDLYAKTKTLSKGKTSLCDVEITNMSEHGVSMITATCRVSGDESEEIYGTGRNSIWRALYDLNDHCKCKKKHMADPAHAHRLCGSEWDIRPTK